MELVGQVQGGEPTQETTQVNGGEQTEQLREGEGTVAKENEALDDVFDTIPEEGKEKKEPVVETKPTETEVKPTETKPTNVTLTDEQLRELVNRPAAETKQTVEAKPMTEAEIKKALNHYEVDDSVMEGLTAGGDRAKQAMNSVAQGIVKNASTVARLVIEREVSAIRAEYAPYVKMAQAAQTQASNAEYYKNNPSHVGLEVLVEKAAKDLMDAKFDGGGDPKKIFAEVSKRVDALAKQLNVTGKSVTTAGKPANNGTSSQSGSKMSPVNAGGQGAAGSSSGGSKPKGDTESAIWD